jgi:methionine-S-sulfoxide reductase
MDAGTGNDRICQITLAGGCFWDIEAGFRGIPGIRATVVGYTGGDEEHPDYIRVSTGETGHVEAVRIAYDPAVITFTEVLDRFFGLFDLSEPAPEAGVPGSQYRPAIFCHDDEDCVAAEAYVRDTGTSGRYDKPVVTVIQRAGPFWPAEECHQQYYEKMANRYRTPLF